jgi:hypothetical protein
MDTHTHTHTHTYKNSFKAIKIRRRNKWARGSLERFYPYLEGEANVSKWEKVGLFLRYVHG